MLRRLCCALALAAPCALAQSQPRARDLGVPFDGTPGQLNAITDVAGVEVGEVTLISGSGKRVVGKGPVRTGVTAILPRGHLRGDTVFAGWFTLNGNGEMTGTTWVDESGMLEGPVLITNTFSVGTVRDATLEWSITKRAHVRLRAPRGRRDARQLAQRRRGLSRHEGECLRGARRRARRPPFPKGTSAAARE